MEKHLRIVTDRTIKMICAEFNVNEEWLRNGRGKMFVEQTIDEKFSETVNELLVTDNDKIKDLLFEINKLEAYELEIILGLLKTINQNK